MALETERALEAVLASGDEWQSWRAARLAGAAVGSVPSIPYQDALGGFAGAAGNPSPGSTGEGLCHLVVLGLKDSAPAVVAADWLDDVRTPAGAWLDRPEDVPGVDEGPSAARVWATAAATCGLLAVGRTAGERALQLVRGEGDLEGRFTGGAYPTFAAAGTYWLAEGPKTELAEWALRWAREVAEEWWGPWELATALTFWGAAGVPGEHPTVELFLGDLRAAAPPEGWSDELGLTLRTLELERHFWG